MNLDEIDFLILKLTMKERGYTSTAMAKMIYSPKDVHELRKKDVIVRKKAKKLLKYGFLQNIEKNGVTYWNIGKCVFKNIGIMFNGKKIKFMGIVIRSGKNFIIHGISE